MSDEREQNNTSEESGSFLGFIFWLAVIALIFAYFFNVHLRSDRQFPYIEIEYVQGSVRTENRNLYRQVQELLRANEDLDEAVRDREYDLDQMRRGQNALIENARQEFESLHASEVRSKDELVHNAKENLRVQQVTSQGQADLIKRLQERVDNLEEQIARLQVENTNLRAGAKLAQ